MVTDISLTERFRDLLEYLHDNVSALFLSTGQRLPQLGARNLIDDSVGMEKWEIHARMQVICGTAINFK